MANKNPVQAVSTVKEFGNLSKACKQMALKRRANSPVQVEKTLDVLNNIQNYIEEQKKHGKPLTHAGFMRCFGVDDNIYYSLDKYDYVIEEFKVLHNLPMDATTYTNEQGQEIPLVPWWDIKKRICDIAIQEQLEENIYSQQRGVNQAGSIFGLKARYNWTEDTTPQHVVNNLVIADGEQARKALDMLVKP